MSTSCIFCTPTESRVIVTSELVYAYWDGFPVTHLHALIIPIRHVPDYFGLSREEVLACDEILRTVCDQIRSLDSTVEGFNIGCNAGSVAGQTIFHCHIHVIPRRLGDTEHPKGGVRHVLPGRGSY